MKKIYLAFLWHQHQPIYKNPKNNVYELPWVRLHAIKDYYDMVAILDDYPKIKLNINLVPSLLIQLEDYSKRTAEDEFLNLTLKQADLLTDEDKIFILTNFFMANWDTMVYPYKRYAELLEKRGKQATASSIKNNLHFFDDKDIRDLQVWFNLSWFDPYWRKNDEFINALYLKGENFTEEDKVKLINKQLDICGKIVEKHKQLQDRGQIEVSVTPFYHPILPLLCDTNSALDATPNIDLPKNRFAHKEDAAWHIENAVKYYEKLFKRKVTGMWPSEGSVSNDVVRLAAQNSLQWLATDEAVLFAANPQAAKNRQYLFRPYKVNIDGNCVNMVFRDHGLSDLIGFVYSKWNPEDAANDFIDKIKNIAKYMDNSYYAPLVSVILDGENCWEYYKNDGWDFLSKLYSKLEKEECIETVRLTDYLKNFPPKDTLNNLKAASWINGNFGIWIGHSEDNKAWDLLSETRNFIVEYTKQNEQFKNSDLEKKVWSILYAAEGSDWNWWYGADHSSSNDMMFDKLFRQHLIVIYELLGQQVPEQLYTPIKHSSVISQPVFLTAPKKLISPEIDGEVTSFFEWKNAGSYSVGHSGGSMHQVSTVINSFLYGFDLDNLYFNIKINEQFIKEIENFKFNINFLNPEEQKISFSIGADKKIKEYIIVSKNSETTKIPLNNIAFQQTVELKIPFEILNLNNENKNFELTVSVDKNSVEVECWPYQATVTFQKPTIDFNYKMWSV